MAEEQHLSALERLVRYGSDHDVRRFYALLRPPELADLLEQLSGEDRKRAFDLMAAPLASDVLRAVEDPELEEILEDMPAERVAEIAHESMTDDAADMIGALDEEKRAETLQHLDGEDRREIEELLEHGEDTAGGLMQTELVHVREDCTVREAMEQLRAETEDEVGDIHVVYIVGADDRLLGTVSPADLITADPDAPLSAVQDRDPIVVPPTMDQEDLAELVREHDLAAVAVVDENRRLLGQVLIDDVIDVMEVEATEDIARMAGTDYEAMFDDSVRAAIRLRAPWLVPAFIGGLVVTFFLGSVESSLKDATILVVFLPVILGMAGNIGTQTSAITVRSLALGRLDFKRVGRAIVRQVLTGLAIGSMFGAALLLFVLATRSGDGAVKKYALTLALAIWTAMTVGATMGVTVPLLLNKLGFDPAIATSPFVQTANDVTGVGILIVIANALDLI